MAACAGSANMVVFRLPCFLDNPGYSLAILIRFPPFSSGRSFVAYLFSHVCCVSPGLQDEAQEYEMSVRQLQHHEQGHGTGVGQVTYSAKPTLFPLFPFPSGAPQLESTLLPSYPSIRPSIIPPRDRNAVKGIG